MKMMRERRKPDEEEDHFHFMFSEEFGPFKAKDANYIRSMLESIEAALHFDEEKTDIWKDGWEWVNGLDLHITDRCLGFKWQIVQVCNDYFLWTYGGGYVRIENLAKILQQILKRTSLREPVFVEWAEVCTLPRQGGYGGGVVQVTRSDLDWWNTFDWIRSHTPGHEWAAEPDPKKRYVRGRNKQNNKRRR